MTLPWKPILWTGLSLLLTSACSGAPEETDASRQTPPPLTTAAPYDPTALRGNPPPAQQPGATEVALPVAVPVQPPPQSGISKDDSPVPPGQQPDAVPLSVASAPLPPVVPDPPARQPPPSTPPTYERPAEQPPPPPGPPPSQPNIADTGT